MSRTAPNEAHSLDAPIALLFHIERHWRYTSERGSYA